MDLAGEYTLAAPPDRVRSALRDRKAVGRLVPAVAEFAPVGPGEYAGTVVVGHPPLGRSYPAHLVVREEEGGEGLALVLTGTGRAEGLHATARCRLRPGPRPGTTLLRYAVTADFGTIGGLFGPAAGRMVGDFFRGLEGELARGGG